MSLHFCTVNWKQWSCLINVLSVIFIVQKIFWIMIWLKNTSTQQCNAITLTFLKLFLFFLTPLMDFSSSLIHAKFTALMCKLFLVLDVLLVVYTPRVHMTELKLTSMYFSLWTNHCFLIGSIHAFYFINNVAVCL